MELSMLFKLILLTMILGIFPEQSFAQVVGGGTGGIGRHLDPKSEFELNKISKQFLNGYSHNLKSCDPTSSIKKVKNFEVFLKSFHQQLIKMAQNLGGDHGSRRKNCSNELESIDVEKRKLFLNCLFEQKEISELRKLLGAKNFKTYLVKNHQLNNEQASELIELFGFIITLDDPTKQNETTTKPN